MNDFKYHIKNITKKTPIVDGEQVLRKGDKMIGYSFIASDKKQYGSVLAIAKGAVKTIDIKMVVTQQAQQHSDIVELNLKWIIDHPEDKELTDEERITKIIEFKQKEVEAKYKELSNGNLRK